MSDNSCVREVDVNGYGAVTVKRLPSGYFRVQGRGSCNWAQGPTMDSLDVYAEAGAEFRSAVAVLKEEK